MSCFVNILVHNKVLDAFAGVFLQLIYIYIYTCGLSNDDLSCSSFRLIASNSTMAMQSRSALL